MSDVDINVNVKTKKRKLEKDYKKLGLTARDILRLTVVAENDLLVDKINKNIKLLSNKINTSDFRKILDDVNDILKLKLNEIKERKVKNKTIEENQNI